jgi:hypothetical protein
VHAGRDLAEAVHAVIILHAWHHGCGGGGGQRAGRWRQQQEGANKSSAVSGVALLSSGNLCGAVLASLVSQQTAQQERRSLCELTAPGPGRVMRVGLPGRGGALPSRAPLPKL